MSQYFQNVQENFWEQSHFYIFQNFRNNSRYYQNIPKFSTEKFYIHILQNFRKFSQCYQNIPKIFWENFYNFYIVKDGGYINLKKKIQNDPHAPTHSPFMPAHLQSLLGQLSMDSQIVFDGLLQRFNNTRLQSDQTGVLISACDLLQMIP